jgi:HAMP domain-containing protein
LSFARGLAQILLDRLEGTLVTPHLSKTLLLTYTSNGGVQSLRLRIPKSRMTALENTFKRDVEKATSDLGVLRRSVAAGVWAKTVEIQKREREAREEIDNSAAR